MGTVHREGRRDTRQVTSTSGLQALSGAVRARMGLQNLEKLVSLTPNKHGSSNVALLGGTRYRL